MRALNSDLLLIDLKLPTSTFTYLKSSSMIDSASSAIRRTRRAHKGVVASAVSGSSFWASVIRRPADRFSGGNGSVPDLMNGASTSWCVVDAELEMFLELLPLRMRRELNKHGEIGELIEVVMDLGRKPIARFPSGDWMISEHPIKADDLRHAISKVGNFSDDNRSGIDSSLHRISAIRNRKMQIIGLTCRVGRAVSGSAETIRDLVEQGGSILVIGPPGVGKTTLIREIARMLADEYQKRVIIVDTSNEIGGDGDVPHSGIGRARRMQVPNIHMQHNVMIEAVENHMPETIIIDEIGTELEALAASTIAQRGVQLVATAHGMTIDNIIKNPSLQNLVGGVESVTLGDEEARKRKVQKTILERKGPPTFTCAIEMISKTECRVHHQLDGSIDAILAGKSPLFEVRRMHDGDSDSLKDSPSLETENIEQNELTIPEHLSSFVESDDVDFFFRKPKTRDMRQSSLNKRSPISVYSYKILDTDVLEVAAAMGLEEQIDVTDDIGAADAILACSSEMKENPGIRGIAKFHQLPVFVIKSNTMAQMVKALRMILGRVTKRSAQKQTDKRYADIEVEDDAPKRKPSLEEIDALEEVRLAIEYIVIPGGEPVELLPRRSDIIARQLELVESYQLSAENSGTDLNPRLQILPLRLNKKVSNLSKYATTGRGKLDSKPKRSGSIIIGGTSINRMPLLPEDTPKHDGKNAMVDRDSGCSRGFGFITYADRRGMEDAIRDMHGRKPGDRIISGNKALPRGEEIDPPSYRGGYSSGGLGGSFARDGPSAQNECFKCGRLGHWASECPSTGCGRGRGGPPLSSHSRYGGGGDRFGGECVGYLDDHYDGARYGDRDWSEGRDMKYVGRDRYVNNRYPPAGDRFGTDRYGGSDRYPLNGFSKDRGYDRDPLPRGGGDGMEALGT